MPFQIGGVTGTVSDMASPLRLLAPAKINLHLRVGKRRDDGFHPLLTWMCTVGLFDILTLETTGPVAPAAAMPRGPQTGGASSPAAGRAGEPAGASLDLRFDCDQPGLPRDEGNLVVRIAKAFAAEVFAPPPLGGSGLSAGGAMGSGARIGGDGGASGSAGAARVEALGMGNANGSASVGFVSGGTGRGAGAARDAEGPVGEEDAFASPPGRGHSRDRRAEAPAVPADSRLAPARVEPIADGERVGRENRGTGVRRAPVGISLAKRIPVGAGLGGGSSDAARTLVGLNRLWNAGWAADRLSGFAARFGSDVPFFAAAAFTGPSAECAGRGEIVRPVAPPAPKWAVLVLAPFPLATRDVYARFDEMGLGSDRELVEAPDWRGWASLAARELLPRLVNDLEPAAFALSPQLAVLRIEAERAAGRVVRMSGSGSSLFTLFDAGDAGAAKAAAEAVRSRCRVTATVMELAPAIADDLAQRRV